MNDDNDVTGKLTKLTPNEVRNITGLPPITEADGAALPVNIAPDMSNVIGEVISDIAEGIELHMDNRKAIRQQGGPYEQSLLIAYEKRLAAAAATALEIVVNHPKLRPTVS